MANISCGCGHVFSDGQIPCPYEYNLIPDNNGEDLTEKVINIVENEEDVFPKIDYLISRMGISVYECPSCGGLLVFWDGLEKDATYYKKS
jgi:predicted hydrocarbon binding protein